MTSQVCFGVVISTRAKCDWVCVRCGAEDELDVFTVGEILILDDREGREVAGQARDPDKWPVEYELYEDLYAAVDRAKEVTRLSAIGEHIARKEPSA
jgi:hypothetical protein